MKNNNMKIPDHVTQTIMAPHAFINSEMSEKKV